MSYCRVDEWVGLQLYQFHLVFHNTGIKRYCKSDVILEHMRAQSHPPCDWHSQEESKCYLWLAVRASEILWRSRNDWLSWLLIFGFNRHMDAACNHNCTVVQSDLNPVYSVSIKCQVTMATEDATHFVKGDGDRRLLSTERCIITV